ncbi:MAG: hypothetical protein LBP38_02055 [Desulfovibrio sp.]|nr:hypothetical protein [Desulfovibrio sp.]
MKIKLNIEAPDRDTASGPLRALFDDAGSAPAGGSRELHSLIGMVFFKSRRAPSTLNAKQNKKTQPDVAGAPQKLCRAAAPVVSRTTGCGKVYYVGSDIAKHIFRRFSGAL